MIKKRQHYVSRNYLRSWSLKEQLYCLRENKIFNSNLMNIAQEKYFYELQDLSEDEIKLIYKLCINPSPESLKKNHIEFLQSYTMPFTIEKLLKGKDKGKFETTLCIAKKNFEEEYHSHIESLGNKYIDLIKNKNIKFFNNKSSEDRMAFLIFVTLQYMRTKKRRNATIDAFKGTKFNMRKLWPIMVHIFSTNMAFSLHLDKKYKLILLENQTEVNFITGDQPLVNTYGITESNNILEHDELEFYYPITPRLSVLISKKIIYDDTLNILEKNEIDKYNSMIIKSSEEQVYALTQEELLNYKSLYFSKGQGEEGNWGENLVT